VYIVAIAWLYVVLLVSFLQSSIFRGVTTFLLAGLLPLAVVLYLAGGPQRGRNRLRATEKLVQTSETTPQTQEQTVEHAEPSSVQENGQAQGTKTNAKPKLLDDPS
jgi:hypothetical protein